MLNVATNTGMLSYKAPVAAAARKYKPIQSAVPGTTLGPIQIDAFLGGGVWTSPLRISKSVLPILFFLYPTYPCCGVLLPHVD